MLVPGAYYEAHGAVRLACVHASGELVAVAASKVSQYANTLNLCQHTNRLPTHAHVCSHMSGELVAAASSKVKIKSQRVSICSLVLVKQVN